MPNMMPLRHARQLLTALTLGLSLTFTAAVQAAGAVRPLTESTAPRVLLIHQEAALGETVRTRASISPVTASLSGLGGSRVAIELPHSPVTPISTVTLPNPTTQEEALKRAKDWLPGVMPAYASRLGAWLAEEGIATATFYYTQEIMVEAPLDAEHSSRKMAIALSATIDATGRALYGSPQLVNPDPTLVEAIYTPLRASEALPADWRYGTEAGTLRWRVFNLKDNREIQGWQVIDTAGAFDEDPASADINSRLRCLVDHRYPECDPSAVDVRGLMNATASSYMRLYYVRAIEPVFRDEPNAAGELEAKLAISVNQRTYDCAAYVNSGVFGALLNLGVDAFVGSMDTDLVRFQQVLSSNTQTVSPTVAYENKAIPAAWLGGQNPDAYIISPLPDEFELWPKVQAMQERDVIYVAPLRAIDNGNGLSAAHFTGNMQVVETYAAASIREYDFGAVGDNTWGNGYHEGEVSFVLAAADQVEEFAIIEQAYDDYMRITVNGDQVFNGPYGGNTLSYQYPLQTQFHEFCNMVSGGSFRCSGVKGALVGPALWHPEAYHYCPAGQLLDGTQCFLTTTVDYGYCEMVYGSGDTGALGWRCNHGCAPGHVQTMLGATGTNPGCWPIENGHDQRSAHYIDLRDYLQSGLNTIRFQIAVGGMGEGYVKVRTRACGSSMDLPVGPVGPTGPGHAEITEALRQQLQGN